MKLFNLPDCPSSHYLATEEALLDHCENTGQETLAFWESSEHIVVLGYGNKTAVECDEARCDADRIPILRRCSGGGTVLQGPGCVNYVLTLQIEPYYSTVQQANHRIMERNRAALSRLLKAQVEVAGYTDLTVGNQKFSGNAQRRKRKALLFHGSILYGFDLSLIPTYLRFPSLQPDYRRNRDHQSFLRNVEASSTAIRKQLAEEWQAQESFDGSSVREGILAHLKERYDLPEWQRRV